MKTIRMDDLELTPDGRGARYFTRVGGGVWSDDLNDYTPDKWGYEDTPIKIGAELTLVEHRNVSPNNIRTGEIAPHYTLYGGPIEGNSNPNITRYHGWRGTWNDHHTEALGVRRVLRLRALKRGGVSVTLSSDLHPDWP